MANLIGDVEWYRGDTYPLELTIKNKNTGEIVDLTGFSFILTIDLLKEPADDVTKLFDVVGILDDDPTTGKVTFLPTSANTDLDPKIYFYDIEMTDASGNIRTIAKYKWKLKQDISK